MIAPLVVILPIFPLPADKLPSSVNQRLPSGPAVIPYGAAAELGDRTSCGDPADNSTAVLGPGVAQFGEPQIAVGPSGDPLRLQQRAPEFGDDAGRGNPADFSTAGNTHAVNTFFSEPEIAVRPSRNPSRLQQRAAELGDHAGRGNPADLSSGVGAAA